MDVLSVGKLLSTACTEGHGIFWHVGAEVEGGMEVGEVGDRLYTYRYYIPIVTQSPPEWLLLYDGQQWQAFYCFINCEEQSHKTVSTNHILFEEKGEPKRNQA